MPTNSPSYIWKYYAKKSELLEEYFKQWSRRFLNSKTQRSIILIFSFFLLILGASLCTQMCIHQGKNHIRAVIDSQMKFIGRNVNWVVACFVCCPKLFGRYFTRSFYLHRRPRRVRKAFKVVCYSLVSFLAFFQDVTQLCDIPKGGCELSSLKTKLQWLVCAWVW